MLGARDLCDEARVDFVNSQRVLSTLTVKIPAPSLEQTFITSRVAMASPVSTPASCQLCGGAFPSKNAMFKHLRDDNAVTGGRCGAWCSFHGGVDEAARKMNLGLIEKPRGFAPPPPPVAKTQKKQKNKSVEDDRPCDALCNGDADAPGGKKTKTYVPETAGSPNELWVGNIPETHCSVKKITQLLYVSIPGGKDIATPVVRHVVRRGWRESTRPKQGCSGRCDARDTQGNGVETTSESASESAAESTSESISEKSSTPKDEPRKKEKGAWVGYAFVVFRDEREAFLARKFIHGKVVVDGDVTITLTAHPATRKFGGSALKTKTGEQATEPETEKNTSRLAPNEDPARVAVARAWSKTVLDLRAKKFGYHTTQAYLHAERLGSYRNTREEGSSDSSDSGGQRGRNDDGATTNIISKVPSPIAKHVSGAPVPKHLLTEMRDALDNTRWPPANHRKGVVSDKYLVLASCTETVTELVRRLRLHENENENDGPSTEKVVDPYGSLKVAAHKIIAHFDPKFQYDRLAITKNFQGSPHCDHDDVTHQYAVSLGDFSCGGQLVVESECGETRWVIDTKDRIAKFDGRFAHWVRGFGDAGDTGDIPGVRYSVIFYANKVRAATAKSFAVDETFAARFAKNGDDSGMKHGESRLEENNSGAVPGAVGGTLGRLGNMPSRVVTCFGAILALGVVVGTRRRGCGRA